MAPPMAAPTGSSTPATANPLNIRKILLPVDFPTTSLPVVRHAAALARRFHSEIVMLHVASPHSHAAGVPRRGPGVADWDMLAAVTSHADKNQEKSLAAELKGIAVHRVLATGDAAHAIVHTAHQQKADLIMMPSRGHTFCEYLLGSVTVKELRDCECPIWTGAHASDATDVKDASESSAGDFSIRHILCWVEFTIQDRKAVSVAAQLAAEFGARLTLAHVTAGVKSWGPGGDHVNARWKESLVDDASHRMSKLQKNMGTQADVFIGSGDVPEVLGHAVRQINADLLITGCHPYGGRLRTHGYAVISAAPVPVLSV
jgi:nucleotide-binding universal stress UspA family protein